MARRILRNRKLANEEVLALLDQTPTEVKPVPTVAEMVQRDPRWQKIYTANPTLATTIAERGGFIKENEIDALIAVDRLMLVLVRCGNGRFLCPAQDVKHFIGIIEEHARLKQEKTGQPMQGDHVRDVSLPND